MEILRLGVGEQDLQEAVHVGGSEEIFTPGYEGDPLLGVVHHDGKVVGSGDITPGEHNVTELSRQDSLGAMEQVLEGDGPTQFCCSP